VEAAEEEGIIEPEQADLIESGVEFSDKRVREVMSRGPKLWRLRPAPTWKSLHAKLLESGFSKLPVYEHSLDDIHGVVYSQDLLQWGHRLPNRLVRELIRPVLFMPRRRLDRIVKGDAAADQTMAVIIDDMARCGHRHDGRLVKRL